MKVFVNKRTGNYSGGMILVAANSKEEAHKAFHGDYDYLYMWDEWDGITVDKYYQPENWEEIKGMTCDVDTPCVIDEDGYSE